MRPLRRTGVALAALVLFLVVGELAARLWVDHVAQRGKLFRHDATLGWSVLPDLDLVRLNADGEPWHVRTGPTGLRGPEAFVPAAEKRLLILGDSFAFGEGVDVQDRFDTLLLAGAPEWSEVNLGVMGYGTDQELIAARPWFDELRAGDALLLLTFANDFHDLALRSHAGRARPWFSLEAGELVEHAPAVGLLEVLRDGSYIAALALQRLRPPHPIPGPDELLEATRVYGALLARDLAPLAERGVRVVVAHHGDHLLEPPLDPEALFATRGGGGAQDREQGGPVAALGFTVVDLDPAVEDPACRLSDGHWTPLGNERVAEALAPTLLGPRLASRGASR